MINKQNIIQSCYITGSGSVEMPSNYRQRRNFWAGEVFANFVYYVLRAGKKTTFDGKIVETFGRNTNIHKICRLPETKSSAFRDRSLNTERGGKEEKLGGGGGPEFFSHDKGVLEKI